MFDFRTSGKVKNVVSGFIRLVEAADSYVCRDCILAGCTGFGFFGEVYVDDIRYEIILQKKMDVLTNSVIFQLEAKWSKQI